MQHEHASQPPISVPVDCSGMPVLLVLGGAREERDSMLRGRGEGAWSDCKAKAVGE